MTKAQKALEALVQWSRGSEPDSYSYFKDVFCQVLGYPKERIKINDRGFHGIPDITFYSQDAVPWVVCEVKPEPGRFRSRKECDETWDKQLKRYVTADTVYALLLDPTTIVVVSPDGKQRSPIELDKVNEKDLLNPNGPFSIASLAFSVSTGSAALVEFIAGTSPMGYIDVSSDEGREAFYLALRLSAGDFRNYATARVKRFYDAYDEYKTKWDALGGASMGKTARLAEQQRLLKTQYKEAIQLREDVLPYFLAQIGREVPTDEKQQLIFVQKVYSTEAANLVLARILFVRFLEDYQMTTRKISNGGIRKFRDFNSYVKDQYQYLLVSAFQDSKAVYARMFEESVYDWAQEGDGELSRILLRVFYRLNAFDFTKVTGDILGNLYERFLDPATRKDMGEFYTPPFVVDYILEAVGFTKEPGPLLDPACGSGTFLFRAIEHTITNFRRKGIPLGDAIQEAVKIVHGLDINTFAAFISQLQVIWYLLPHLTQAGITKLPEFKIYGGIDSLETGTQVSLDEHLMTPREDAAAAIRENRYQYVVGNPPYVRAERLKTKTRWSDYYKEVATGKKDISFYFLYRSLEGGKGPIADISPWLEEGGTMGFIVPFGIADSKAALSLRKVILRNNLRELVDLESLSNEVFTSQIASSRSTVAPIIVVASKKARKDDYAVQVTSPTRATCLKGSTIDLSKAIASSVPRSTFTDEALNPFQMFVTKIQSDDVDLVRKLLSNRKLEEFAERLGPSHRAIQVGVQTGRGKGKIFPDPGEGRFPMAKGSHVHAFVLNSNQISEYVELAKVENDSLWGHPSLLEKPAFALSELGFAPQACQFSMKDIVAQKSCIVFVPSGDNEDFPWDVYLNSRIPRYLFGLVLRSALFEGTEDLWRAHVNSEAIKLFPVPEALLAGKDTLKPAAKELRTLAKRILTRWQEIDDQIASSPKVSLALVPKLRYVNVHDYDIFKNVPVEYQEQAGVARLQPVWRNQPTLDYIEGSPKALRVIKYMMDHPDFNLTPSPSAEIPKDYDEVASKILEADVSRNPDIKRFNDTLEETETIIAKAFSLTKKDAAHIKARLNAQPFSSMEPRWPWIPAAIRDTRIYEEDRFA
ncbi:MAG: N-6 DNA methylase [Nitrososphaerota archaeon]|nr:N-6 DNA methylase [Nitrososphaerota archaeon]MDG7023706.1 N-6 DNA methylase [Nitrososphaerota archaeon]